MKGKLIVIEGLDGAGKSTQIKLLKTYYSQLGFEHKFIHFPMLNQGIYGTLIAEFLRGEYGSLDEVHPKLVALLFANDRKEHIHLINGWLEAGYMVLADRYVNSNIAFQCAKCHTEEDKQRLKDWILDFEYNTHQLPQADASFFLDVPFSAVINALNNNRTGEDRDYLDGKQDIHEASIDFQRQVYTEYKKMVTEQAKLYRIDCSGDDGQFLAPEVINEMIVERLKVSK